MFGLSVETTLLVFGFPLFWIIYTAVFLYRTKHWSKGDTQQDDSA